MTNERNQLLTVEAAADALGLKPPTLRAWIAKRRICYVRLGRRIAIKSSEIDRLIERGTVPALPDRPR